MERQNSERSGEMLSFVISHKDDKPLDRLLRTIKNTCSMDYETIIIDNKRREYSLCGAYNRGYSLTKGDYIIFCHEDIELLIPKWNDILLHQFEKFDALGVIGSVLCNTGRGVWFGTLQKSQAPQCCGTVIVPHIPINPLERLFLNHLPLTAWSGAIFDFTTRVVTVDGLFIAVKREVMDKVRWDEETFTDFHMYDLDFCMQLYEKKIPLGIAPILIAHYGMGRYTLTWTTEANKFRKKWGTREVWAW